MAYSIVLTRSARKSIKKLSPQIQKRLQSKLEFFAAQEKPLDFAEPLTKPADAAYRFRTGSYRILFDVQKDKLVILFVQHRKDIYRKS